VAGALVSEEASGPGVIDPQDDRTVPSYVEHETTNDDGTFEIFWRIRSFGTYTVRVTSVLVRAVERPLDASSTTSVSYTVSESCTPP
jgi:hypothetical protein